MQNYDSQEQKRVTNIHPCPPFFSIGCNLSPFQRYFDMHYKEREAQNPMFLNGIKKSFTFWLKSKLYWKIMFYAMHHIIGSAFCTKQKT